MQHHPDDRLHYGPDDDVAVPLSFSVPERWSDNDHRPPALVALLEQMDTAAAPTVAVSIADVTTMRLTVPELRAWVAYLRRLLSLADPCGACDAGQSCAPHRAERRRLYAVGGWAHGRADSPDPMATVPGPRTAVA